MRKILLILIIVLILPSTLSGCYDASEIDDYTYIVLLGVDKGSQEKYKITIQIPTVAEQGQTSDVSMQNAAKVNSPGYSIISVEAPSILAGMNLLNTNLSRKLTLKHQKAIIFSEEIAKEGLSGFMGIGMYKDVRRPITIYIAKSGAANFIYQNKQIVGTNISKTIEYINEQGHNTGFYESFTNIDFYRYVKSPFIQPTAILAGIGKTNGTLSGTSTDIIHESAGNTLLNGESQRNVIGTAVFRGDKMVGELDGDQTRVFMMVINEFKRAFIDVPDPLDPDSLINFDVWSRKPPKITAKIKNGKPNINVILDIEAGMNSVRSNINYQDPSLLPNAQNALKGYLQEILDELIKKCQQEYNSDIFGFGNYLGKNFLTIQEWEKYNWLDKFGEANITAEVKVNIENPGLLNELSPVKKGD